MIAWILMLTYIFRYWNYPNPPVHDIISPFITLTIALNIFIMIPSLCPESLYGLRYQSLILIILSLIIDSIADYFMDRNNLELPILLFSLGHFIKQIIFAYIFSNGIYSLVHVITFILILYLISLVLQRKLYAKENTLIAVAVYSIIIALTLIQICVEQQGINRGFLLFVISDLIIAIELVYVKFTFRQIRVILVPLLYWIAEILISRDLLIIISE
jgi:hypothetical protein